MEAKINLAALIHHPPFELTAVDKAVLTTAEEDFISHSWEDLKTIIARGDTSLLRRTPSDLRNYMLWTRQIQTKFGSATNFVVQNRLHWTAESQTAGSALPDRDATPFRTESDYRILRNDWPYAMSPGMTHLVVWSKIPIPVNGDGDPTLESHRMIAEFVERIFAKEMSQRQHAGDNIQWFRNRTQWQSVRTLEHFHILLRDADEGFVTALTGQGPQDAEYKAFSVAMD